MVSWWHGTVAGASAGPARTTTCTKAKPPRAPRRHATMSPCHLPPTLSSTPGRARVCSRPSVTHKGRGVTSTKFDSNIFCEKEVSWCHGGMDSGRWYRHPLNETAVGASAGPGRTTTCTE